MVSPQVVSAYGQKFSIAYSDPSHIRLVRKKKTFLERDLLDKTRSLGLCGVAIDVGANVGNHSIYMAKLCNFSRVFSIEPHPETCKLLMDNIAANGCHERISPIQIAAGSRAGSTGITSKKHTGQNTLCLGQEVAVDSIDSLLCDSQRISLIKIDVEGGELDVVRGAIGTIRSNMPHLFVETFGPPEKVLEVLPKGYRVLGRYANAPTYHFQFTQ